MTDWLDGLRRTGGGGGEEERRRALVALPRAALVPTKSANYQETFRSVPFRPFHFVVIVRPRKKLVWVWGVGWLKCGG